MTSLPFSIIYLDEAREDLDKLSPAARPIILQKIFRVSQNPLPQRRGGYGKPLGHHAGTNLTGLFKIKFRKLGIRVVYALREYKGEMVIVVISAREDGYVYSVAAKRRENL